MQGDLIRVACRWRGRREDQRSNWRRSYGLRAIVGSLLVEPKVNHPVQASRLGRAVGEVGGDYGTRGTERGFGVEIKESLDICNLFPCPLVLVIVVKVPNIGI